MPVISNQVKTVGEDIFLNGISPTPTPTPSPTPDPTPSPVPTPTKNGSSTLIIAIVIVVVVLLAVLAGYYCYRKKKQEVSNVAVNESSNSLLA